MARLLASLGVVVLLFIVVVAADLSSNSTPKKPAMFEDESLAPRANRSDTILSANGRARCYDSRLAAYIDTALTHYSHDMQALSKYILDQVLQLSLVFMLLVFDLFRLRAHACRARGLFTAK